VLFTRRIDAWAAAASHHSDRLFLELFAQARSPLHDARRGMVVFAGDFVGLRVAVGGVYQIEELTTVFQWLCAFAPDIYKGLAVDVGANIGNHSLFFSDYFDEVCSFAPNPRTHRVLELNAALRPNIRRMNLGLSDAAREAEMTTPSDNMGHAHIAAVGIEGATRIALQPLDAVWFGKASIKLMKVDVEGHEYEMFLGAKRTIAEHRPLILFEQSAGEWRDGTSKVIELLRTYGYGHFAAVECRTRRSLSMSEPWDAVLARVSRLPPYKSYYLGTEWRIVYRTRFESRHYPFILAVPDWLTSRSPGTQWKT
jgi:FkbM family methyltransferase